MDLNARLDINLGRKDGRKTGHLYRTLLKQVQQKNQTTIYPTTILSVWGIVIKSRAPEKEEFPCNSDIIWPSSIEIYVIVPSQEPLCYVIAIQDLYIKLTDSVT